MNPEQALGLTDDDKLKLRSFLTAHVSLLTIFLNSQQQTHPLFILFLSQNLPLFNPVLIVEVLVNRPIQNSEEGNVEQVMKFTFGEDDLRECFG